MVLFPKGLDGSISGGAGKLGDDDGSEGQPLEGCGVTGDRLLAGSIDKYLESVSNSQLLRKRAETYALVVDDLDNGR